MVTAVPREKPVPNVSAVPIVPIVSRPENHSDNLLVPTPSMCFARLNAAGGCDLSGDLNRDNVTVSDPIWPIFHAGSGNVEMSSAISHVGMIES